MAPLRGKSSKFCATFQQFVCLLAMGWSAAMLTAGYLGIAKPDSAFVASVLGSAIGAAGIQIKDEKNKTPTPKAPRKPRIPKP
jgi:hypothetical protein